MKIDLFLQGFHLPDVLIGTPSCFISLNLIVFTFRFHLEVLWEILPENARLRCISLLGVKLEFDVKCKMFVLYSISDSLSAFLMGC